MAFFGTLSLPENDSPCRESFCTGKFPAKKGGCFGLSDVVSRHAAGQLNVIGYRRPDRIELARAAGDQADAKARRHGVVPLGSPVESTSLGQLPLSAKLLISLILRRSPHRRRSEAGPRQCRRISRFLGYGYPGILYTWTTSLSGTGHFVDRDYELVRYRAFCRPGLRACPLHWLLLWRTLTTLWHRSLGIRLVSLGSFLFPAIFVLPFGGLKEAKNLAGKVFRLFQTCDTFAPPAPIGKHGAILDWQPRVAYGRYD